MGVLSDCAHQAETKGLVIMWAGVEGKPLHEVTCSGREWNLGKSCKSVKSAPSEAPMHPWLWPEQP